MVAISDLFVNVEELPSNIGGFVQLLFLMGAYAYFLKLGSTLISDGSELLLLVPSLAGIVGSVVLPVLGAVPDGAIVLFSGLGADAQAQLNIGVGALAGSTVMLLTLPWALCILAGRVDLDAQTGEPVYKRPVDAGPDWKKLTPNAGVYHALFRSGIVMNKPMRLNAVIMLVGSLAYLIIQIPAFSFGCGDGANCSRAAMEHWPAFAGFAYALLAFLAYLVYQVKVGGASEVEQDRVTQMVSDQVSAGHVNVATAFFAFFHANNQAEGAEQGSTRLLDHEAHSPAHIIAVQNGASGSGGGASSNDVHKARAENRLRTMLKRFFKKYAGDDNLIDIAELSSLLRDLGQPLSASAVQVLFKSMDASGDGMVDFEEFAAAIMLIVQRPKLVEEVEAKARAEIALKATEKKAQATKSRQSSMANLNATVQAINHAASSSALQVDPAAAPTEASAASASSSLPASLSTGASPLGRASFVGSSVGMKVLPAHESAAGDDSDDEHDEEDEEEEEVPDDLKHLSPVEQQSSIKKRAAWMMGLGTLLIILFSDPMVDALANLGERIHVPGFYVAFLLAPLAANLSELMAAVNYAAKKTPSTITISITSLEGGATMNNTFCLLIFLILIFAKDLIWEFSAETIAILVVEVVVALMTLKRVHRGIDAVLLLSLYPLSMALVAILENAAGLN